MNLLNANYSGSVRTDMLVMGTCMSNKLLAHVTVFWNFISVFVFGYQFLSNSLEISLEAGVM